MSFLRSTLLAVFAAVSILVNPSIALAGPVTATYQLTDLTPWVVCPGGYCAEAWSINDAGQVTGTVKWSGAYRAFLADQNSTQILDSLGGDSSTGWAINASGQVAGKSGIGDFRLPAYAVTWTGSSLVNLGALDLVESVGSSINDLGQVAGYAWGLGVTKAFFWDGVMHEIGTLGGKDSWATDINASGIVVGSSTPAGLWGDYGFYRAFLWDGTTMQDLGTLADDPDLGDDLGGSQAFAINDAGQVAGETSTLPDGYVHAFVWEDGVMRDLGTLGGRESFATAINEVGQVIGNSSTPAGHTHAFFWSGGVMQDLGALGLEGARSQANGVNNSGYVVGNVTTATGESHAFLWDGSTSHDLNDLIDAADPLKPFVTLLSAWRINGRGDVAAEGRDSRTLDIHVYLVSAPEIVELLLEGFSPPVDPAPILNDAVAGQTIPLKFHVAQSNGTAVADVTSIQLNVVPSNCSDLGTSAIDSIEQFAVEGQGLINKGEGNYQYNWKVPKSATGCWVVELKLPNAYPAHLGSLKANFHFRK